MFLSGTKQATLHAVRMVDIHGTRFYDLSFSHRETPDQLQNARIGVEDSYPDPKPGDLIGVRYVMNVVVAITLVG